MEAPTSISGGGCHLSVVSEKALSYGMCPVLWDAGSSGDMLFLDRKSVTWNDTTIEKNYQELAEKYKNGQISTQTPEIKITLLFESSGQPAVTTTTQKPVETTVTTTTTKAPETTVTTTQKPDDTTVTTTTTESPSVVVKGDVDGNGNLTATDLAKLMQALVGKVTLTENQTKAADMNNDGNISILDLIMLKNLLISD